MSPTYVTEEDDDRDLSIAKYLEPIFNLRLVKAEDTHKAFDFRAYREGGPDLFALIEFKGSSKQFDGTGVVLSRIGKYFGLLKQQRIERAPAVIVAHSPGRIGWTLVDEVQEIEGELVRVPCKPRSDRPEDDNNMMNFRVPARLFRIIDRKIAITRDPGDPRFARFAGLCDKIVRRYHWAPVFVPVPKNNQLSLF